MQTEVAFLGHIVGRAGLACDPEKLSAVWAWHTPGSVKQLNQFVGFVGILSLFHSKLCGIVGTSGGLNTEADRFCPNQFVGFVGYYRCFIQNFVELSEPLVALTLRPTGLC